MLFFINLPTAVTLAGIILSLAAMQLALQGALHNAWICFIGAGLADLFDGPIARKTRMSAEEASLGIQIDSIADMVSFGIAPIILIYSMGATSLYDSLILAFYVLASAQRLSYFNVHGTTKSGETSYYTGLPVTFSALLLPLLYIIQNALLDYTAGLLLMRAAILFMAILYISKLPIPKPTGIWYAIFPVIAIACSTYLLIS